MTDRRDSPDISDKMLPKEPIDRTDAADPTLPMLRTDPTLPIDRQEFVEPMHNTDRRERKLIIDDVVLLSRFMGTMVSPRLGTHGSLRTSERNHAVHPN